MNGKILWICKESFTSLVNYTLPHFSNFDNEALFIHPTESLLKDNTYLNFLLFNPCMKTHTLNDISLQYSVQMKSGSLINVKQQLERYVNKYCDKLPWGELLMSSQIFTTPYHYRFYFKDLEDQEKEFWVLLLFQYLERLLIKSKPNYIFDFDNSEIGRTVLWLIAQKLGIPYITMEHMRYNSYIMPTFTLGRYTDAYFKEKYFEVEASTSNILEVERFRELSKIMVEDYSNNKTSKQYNEPLFKDLKKLLNFQFSTIRKTCRKIRIVGVNFTFPFIANYTLALVFFFKLVFRERYLLSRFNCLFEAPDKHDKYIYFPLHLVPESSTLIKAPFFPNEEEIIRAVSKSLPLGWKLYIKEHGAMVGERPVKFYKSIKRLSNIKFIRMDAFNDPKDWINRSQGVITLTGTGAFEAAMLGKPSIVLGNVPFEVIRSVHKCTDFTLLPSLIQEYFVENFYYDNVIDCAKYLQVIQTLGEKVEFTFLHKETLEGIINKKEKLDDKVCVQIFSLSKIFKKAICLIQSNKI